MNEPIIEQIEQGWVESLRTHVERSLDIDTVWQIASAYAQAGDFATIEDAWERRRDMLGFEDYPDEYLNELGAFLGYPVDYGHDDDDDAERKQLYGGAY